MESLHQQFQTLYTLWQESDVLVGAALILFAGLLMHVVLAALLRRAHRIAELSVNRWDDVLVSALEGPLRTVLWVVVVYLSLEHAGLLETSRKLALQAYDTALVLVLAWFVHRLIREVENELLDESRGRTSSSDKATIHATAKLLRITLWVLAALMALQSVGVSVSGLLAFGGIGGIAVGFAAKDLLANFFGALTIYLDRPFAPGDWIRSPDRNIEGTVEEIGWRLTRIRTFDQRPLYVPNAAFTQISVENPSRMFNRRIYETIGLRYQDSACVGAVIDGVRSMLEAHPDIDRGRTLIVNFTAFGPSSLDFFIYTFTKTTNWVEFHRIKQDVLLRVLEIIHAQGADVAFPTRTLHLEQVASEEALAHEPGSPDTDAAAQTRETAQ